MHKGSGYFITLEGCEGSGKSTQLKMLCAYLEEKGIDAVYTREPGGTVISEKIRSIILDNENKIMSDEAEALLYAASRIQNVKEKILPALESGKTVICDRYVDSSFAYQAYARGLGYDFIYNINEFAIKTCMPDMTLFFDISPERAFERKGGVDTGDRIELSGLDFHKSVYNGYNKLAEKFSDRIVRIDATKSKAEIFANVKANLNRLGIV